MCTFGIVARIMGCNSPPFLHGHHLFDIALWGKSANLYIGNNNWELWTALCKRWFSTTLSFPIKYLGKSKHLKDRCGAVCPSFTLNIKCEIWNLTPSWNIELMGTRDGKSKSLIRWKRLKGGKRRKKAEKANLIYN